MAITKKDLEERFGISHNTVRDTLRACGLDTGRRDYTEEEIESYFAVARKLLDEGRSYEEVAATFRENCKAVSSTTGSEVVGSSLAEEVAREVEEGGREVIRYAVRRMIERLPQLTQEVCDEFALRGDVREVYRQHRDVFLAEVGGPPPARGLFGASSDDNNDDDNDAWESTVTRIE